ncbi:response regulator transcription factor [Compostibacter hankyongensis]|uniref:LytTR family DNA-binding domain-containing protein n=1 Tax=Compostibacter hankyongensis TaxID=1007089 RepID=A0ABP8FL06_9BACT
MLKCIAIDDEQLALDLLEDYIRNVPYLELKARCRNVPEAIKELQQQTVDLLFLDIMMPGITGLQFIESMRHRPMIILVTAYEKYALEGFNLDVIDYLVKPVPLQRFIKACNKAWEYRRLDLVQENRQPSPDAGYFFVNADYSLVKVVISDIVWIEGLKDYIKIHLQSTSRPVVTLMNMKTIEDQLPAAGFIRIHKSYIISIMQITAIRKNSIFIGTTELPVGGSYRSTIEALVRNSGQSGTPFS